VARPDQDPGLKGPHCAATSDAKVRPYVTPDGYTHGECDAIEPLRGVVWRLAYCRPSVISPVSRFTTPSRGRSRGVLVPRRIVVCASRL
jgi:hypothetical protein